MFPDIEELEKTIDRALAYINTLKMENKNLKQKIEGLESSQEKAKQIIDRILEKVQQIER